MMSKDALAGGVSGPIALSLLGDLERLGVAHTARNPSVSEPSHVTLSRGLFTLTTRPAITAFGHSDPATDDLTFHPTDGSLYQARTASSRTDCGSWKEEIMPKSLPCSAFGKANPTVGLEIHINRGR